MSLTKSRNRMTSGAPVCVKDYGAALDGVTDDTAAWNLALATGRSVSFPEGDSVITGKLSYAAVEGQKITASCRRKSRFLISYTTFNMAATAVLQLNSAYQGLQNVAFVFNQPSTALRANIKEYPAAIDLNGYSRAEISTIRIEGGWVGIRAQGNCGGAIIDDIQIGVFYQGLVIDGALDSVRLNRYHFWPFGISGDADLYAIYSDGNTVSMDIGRCDDLNAASILSFRARIIFTDHGSGAPFGVMSDITLDSDYGRVEFVAGEMVLSSVYGSTAKADDYIIRQTGGELKINGLAMEAAVDLSTYAMVQIEGGVFTATNIMSTIIAANTRAFRQTAGTMMLTNGFFQTAANQIRPLSVIEVIGGRAILNGLRCSDKGTGTGDFIKVTNDEYHVVVNNSAPGWTYTAPTTQVLGVYGPNSGASTYVSSFLVGTTRIKKITGILDVAGAITIAHGIASAQASVVSAAAFYTDGSGDILAISGVKVGTTNLTLTAGGGGSLSNFTAQITYTQ